MFYNAVIKVHIYREINSIPVMELEASTLKNELSASILLDFFLNKIIPKMEILKGELSDQVNKEIPENENETILYCRIKFESEEDILKFKTILTQ